jgi:WD40 repeat protein
LDTGREVQQFRGHAGPVFSAGISPDGSQVVSGSYDTTVRVWDLQTGRVRHVGESHRGAVLSVAWAPDGSRVASGGADHAVYVWDFSQSKRGPNPPEPTPGGRISVTAGTGR